MTVVDDFAADYFVSEGLTPGRRVLVRRTLGRLERYAGCPAEDVDDLTLRAWVTAQVAEGLHINTVRKHLHAVKPFFHWCFKRRIIDADRWMRIRDVGPPRGSTGQGRPRPYSRQEIQSFWTQLDARYPLTSDRIIRRYLKGTSRYRRVARHAQHLQTQAAVSLTLFGGLRSTEARTLTLDNLHPDNDFIVVHGKSPFGEQQGYREVPYTAEGRELVAKWLDFRDTVLKPKHNSPWLILSPRASPNATRPSHPLAPISVEAWSSLASRVGKGWEFHRFRHTAATEWLRAGVELEQVSRLLGHATIGQTLCYAELVREDVARGMRRAESDFVTAVGRQAKEVA